MEGMVMKRVFCLATVISTLILFGANIPVWGAAYPTRPVTMINPQPPGGFLDLQTRTFGILAEKMVGQPFVLVNKPGAHGMVGCTSVLQAPPDGYTLLVGSVNITGTVEFEIAEGRKPPFTRQDFIPIGSFTLSPPIIIVPYESSWKTLADMIKDAKAKPGFYAYSHGGLYGMAHVPAAIFAMAAGLKFRSVPYAGGGPAITAVVGKQVDFQMSYPNTSLPLVKGNKLRVLGVMGDKRLRTVPEIPTVKESGVDAEYYAWVGILASKRTPEPVVERLREIVNKVANDKAFSDVLEKDGTEVRYMDHNELTKYWDLESERIGKVMKQMVKEASAK